MGYIGQIGSHIGRGAADIGYFILGENSVLYNVYYARRTQAVVQ